MGSGQRRAPLLRAAIFPSSTLSLVLDGWSEDERDLRQPHAQKSLTSNSELCGSEQGGSLTPPVSDSVGVTRP